jgi:hypothetical protein
MHVCILSGLHFATTTPAEIVIKSHNILVNLASHSYHRKVMALLIAFWAINHIFLPTLFLQVTYIQETKEQSERGTFSCLAQLIL